LGPYTQDAANKISDLRNTLSDEGSGVTDQGIRINGEPNLVRAGRSCSACFSPLLSASRRLEIVLDGATHVERTSLCEIKVRKIIMNLCNPPSILSKLAILIISSAIAANAADSFSDADKAFVAKVSQGGMYEVELGKLAITRWSATS
jgi:hypothetical protein